MREKIINIIVLIVVLCLGIGGTYYFMSSSSSNGNAAPIVKRNVTVTESDSINESIQKVYDSVVVISNLVMEYLMDMVQVLFIKKIIKVVI